MLPGWEKKGSLLETYLLPFFTFRFFTFAFWPWNLKNSFECHNWQYMKTETGYIVWIWFCGWSEFQLGFPTLYQFSCFTKKLQFQARCRTYCLQPWLKCSNEQKKHEIFTFLVPYFPESRKNIWDTAARIERKVKSTIFFFKRLMFLLLSYLQKASFYIYPIFVANETCSHSSWKAFHPIFLGYVI